MSEPNDFGRRLFGDFLAARLRARQVAKDDPPHASQDSGTSPMTSRGPDRNPAQDRTTRAPASEKPLRPSGPAIPVPDSVLESRNLCHNTSEYLFFHRMRSFIFFKSLDIPLSHPLRWVPLLRGGAPIPEPGVMTRSLTFTQPASLAAGGVVAFLALALLAPPGRGRLLPPRHVPTDPGRHSALSSSP